ncbi:hypothetical protein QJS66_04575 [Kocuria rhizophila]|nr:hypothetical protein QJS66_04575 [Kocuria rhizophila]
MDFVIMLGSLLADVPHTPTHPRDPDLGHRGAARSRTRRHPSTRAPTGIVGVLHTAALAGLPTPACGRPSPTTWPTPPRPRPSWTCCAASRTCSVCRCPRSC